MPTLVIHGRDDTLITPSGGTLTAEAIPEASLLLLAHMGHDLPEPLWPVIVDAVISHTVHATATAPPPFEEHHHVWTTDRVQGHRDRRHRARPVLRHAAGRHGGRRHPRRPRPVRARPGARRPGPRTCPCAAGAASPSTSSTPTAWPRCSTSSSEADALIEGFRPGVMERLGIGPDECFARNPKLVFGRMTGWGQDGPYAPWAGHDINYISLAGALAHIGRAGEAPVPPLNLVGDFGGGGMFLAFGVVCAMLEAQTERRGPGRRRGDGRRHGHADVDVLVDVAVRRVGRRATGAPTCSTPAPTSTTPTSARTGRTSRSARSSRSSTPSCCA